MAREHGRLAYTLFRDSDFRALSRSAQALYMQLLAQKEINNAGVCPLMVSKWARGCDELDEAAVWVTLRELQAARFVFFDEESEELLVRSFIRNDGILKQPNLVKNALRCAEQVESETLRGVLAEELRRLGRRDAEIVADGLDGRVSEPIANPSETLPEPLNPSETLSKPRGVGEGVGEGGTLTSVGTCGGGSRASAREATAPPPGNLDPSNPRCPKHLTVLADDMGPNCRACRRVREWCESAPDRAAADDLSARRSRREAIDACGLCDDTGYVLGVEPVRRCAHLRPAQES